MAKTEKEKTPEDAEVKKKKAISIESAAEEDATTLPFSTATDSLMPELEELVKKNPNRLIGCGG